MSNKTQLQTNNEALDGYIARVNAAKDVAANLPEAGVTEPNIVGLKITENGTYTASNGVDGFSPVIVDVPTGGGGSNNHAKFLATPDSSTSFIIENPLGGIAKMVSIKAISPTITSSRKIHSCCLDWDLKLGVVKAYYTSGEVTYAMEGTEETPNNGQFIMTESFITAYRFNSATTWDTSCEYEIEIFQ